MPADESMLNLNEEEREAVAAARANYSQCHLMSHRGLSVVRSPRPCSRHWNSNVAHSSGTCFHVSEKLTPSYVEQRMLQHKTKEIELEEIVDVGSDKRVAAAAFYNCLSKLHV